MMNGYRSNSLNQFWLYSVLIHMIGSVTVVLFIGESWGLILFNSIFWGYMAYANRQKKAGIFVAALGWSLNLYFLTHMPLSFTSSLLMNMFLLTYISYLHYGSLYLVLKENNIRRIGLKEIILILVLTPLYLIIGGYINAISMIFVHNYVKDVLTAMPENLFFGIVVLAVVPAIVEELAYRGFIFQRLGSGWKTVLISASLFALRHMNLNQILYAFVMGILLAMVYQLTGNLICSICIHMLFNLYSVLTAGFINYPLTQKVTGLSVGGYQLFNALLVDENGVILYHEILIGAVVACLALLIILAIFFYLKKMNQKAGEEPMMEAKEKNWKPDYVFILGCVLCILSGFMIK